MKRKRKLKYNDITKATSDNFDNNNNSYDDVIDNLINILCHTVILKMAVINANNRNNIGDCNNNDE